MNAPQAIEQVADAPKDTSSLLAETFDTMAADIDTGEHEDESSQGLDAQETQGEEESQTVVTGEPELELATEAEAAAESEYNDPAPERWTDEYKEYYNGLSPKGKEIFLGKMYKPMQAQYTKATQEISGMRKTIEPMLGTLEKHRNTLERMGVNPEEAFNTQMAWVAHIAEVGPKQGIADMQKAYGLNSSDSQEQGAKEYLTPTERKMQGQIDELTGQVAETSNQNKNWQDQQRGNAQNAHELGVRNELSSFINEQKDGKPAHPHIEKVAPAISGIIKGGLIKNVDEYGQPVPIKTQMAQAYTMACRLDPSISTANSSVRQVTSAKAAKDADVVAKTPSGQGDVPKLTMAEHIDAQYDTLKTRG
jgi:hypothetical protein